MGCACMKREVPLAISFLTGFAMMIFYYVPAVESYQDKLLDWFGVLTVFAFILGIGSMLIVNGNKIQRRSTGWGYNVVLLVSFFITLAVGLVWGTREDTPFDWVFKYVYSPLSGTMFSLLAFFIASAAFRAFKAKSAEATLLLLTAFIVMIGRVPIGEHLWNALQISRLMPINELIDHWIMGAFNTAGQRAILLGASIGIISMSLKILLGIERSYLGGD